MTALLLAPASSSSSSRSENERVQYGSVYRQQLELLEVDCIEESPLLYSAGNEVIPAKHFWKTGDPSTRKIITTI
jgi:hypothetical protein